MFDVLLMGGKVVDGSGLPRYATDVALEGGRIAAMGKLGQAEAKLKLDVAGKVVAPGFIDAHVHGDLALLADPFHEPAIRQGVTTYLIGQDGVAMAPASPETLAYMRRYTAGFSGTWKINQTWSSLDEYLRCFDQRCALNVAMLIPNGNLRHAVMGLTTRPPDAEELKQMGRMVREAMDQGAVGLSTGLDYIPSRYAETEELIALCREMADYGGLYVTHMRGYAPETVIDSMDEVYRIGREAGVAVHISHFNSRADIVIPHLDRGREAGIDVTFDLYCYLAGSTILGMIALPAEVQEGGAEPTLQRLGDPEVRRYLRDNLEGPRGPVGEARLSFVAAKEYKHLEGRKLSEAAKETGKDLSDLICDVLLASDLAVGCVAPHLRRGQEDIRQLMRHPAMMGGSDGIFTGNFPHPRGCGCFARYLGHHVRGDKTWTLEEAVEHLAGHAARRYGLKDRGFLRENLAADVVVFDADKVADLATYEDGRRLATGMEHVFVNGQAVLLNGQRTDALPGRGLRMSR